MVGAGAAAGAAIDAGITRQAYRRMGVQLSLRF
jgi:hypothetical protein